MPALHLIRGRRGSSLLAVLFISAILAIILPILIIYLQNAFDRQGMRSRLEVYGELVKSLRRQLEDPQNCPLLLGGVTVPDAVDGKVSLSLTWTYNSSSGAFQAGWVSSEGGVTVDDVYLRRTGDVFNTVRVVQPAHVSNTYSSIPVRVYVNPRNLIINLGDLDTAKGGTAQSPESVNGMVRPELMIQLHADVDAARKIVTCFGARTVGAVCEAVGGAYNYLGQADLRCQPDQICLSGAGGLVTSPAACVVGDITYKANPMGKVSGVTQYLCTLCHEDL